ncbi:MAG: HNH endonuclease [Planctomycetota bacterium]
MSCKPDIKVTKAMYDLYQKGYSLSQIGEAFGVSRQTIYMRFSRRNLIMRQKQPLPFIFFEGRKYTLRKNGYYGCTNGNRDYLHRDIWQSVNGEIPEGHDIHHKDNDKTHNILSNFELITKSEHSSMYPHRRTLA